MSILVTGGAGYIGTHTLVELLNGGYEVVVMDNFSNSSPKAIKAVEELTGKKIVCYEADINSREDLERIFSEHPDIKVIYAPNQPGTVGACEAIDELGRADDITLVGFDYFDGADAYIQSGVLDAVIAQNPYNMGYLGVRYAKRLLDGDTIAASVDTGATLITADNLQDADIRWLIDPTGK